MNFFTQELKKIADRSEYIRSPKFVGKACVFRLSDDVTCKIEFVTRDYAKQYSAIKVSLFNKREGPIDIQIIDFGDIIGYKNIWLCSVSVYLEGRQ